MKIALKKIKQTYQNKVSSTPLFEIKNKKHVILKLCKKIRNAWLKLELR